MHGRWIIQKSVEKREGIVKNIHEIKKRGQITRATHPKKEECK